MNSAAPSITLGGRLPPGYVAPALPMRPRWTSLQENAFRIQQVSMQEATAARLDLHNALLTLGGDFRHLAQYSSVLAEHAPALRDLLAPFDPRNPDEVRE